ncbi:hypothetical protein HanRHA438_Chr02g0050941 [Helianthus annuus]|nr:hypothetical protein HanRHA438_Chr02g0050941 [Helianthus annuus]
MHVLDCLCIKIKFKCCDFNKLTCCTQKCVKRKWVNCTHGFASFKLDNPVKSCLFEVEINFIYLIKFVVVVTLSLILVIPL